MTITGVCLFLLRFYFLFVACECIGTIPVKCTYGCETNVFFSVVVQFFPFLNYFLTKHLFLAFGHVRSNLQYGESVCVCTYIHIHRHTHTRIRTNTQAGIVSLIDSKRFPKSAAGIWKNSRKPNTRGL